MAQVGFEECLKILFDKEGSDLYSAPGHHLPPNFTAH